MDNHPIPQDVTGFQFKLIGEMTLKQFAYLGTGALIAWIIIAQSVSVIIKFPLALFFAVTGFSLAFVPFEGRPIDTLLINFFKALFSPNQYIFKKVGGQLVIPVTHLPKKTVKTATKMSRNDLQTLLGYTKTKKKDKLDEKETIFFQSLSGMLTNVPVAAPAPAPQPKPQKPKEEAVTASNAALATSNVALATSSTALEKEAWIIRKELEEVKKEEKAVDPHISLEAHQKALELEKLLKETMAQKENLEKELFTLQQRLSVQKQDVFTPTIAIPPKSTENVRMIPKDMRKTAGLPFTPDVPNVIVGIIKDARNNVLPNILVEVKDKEGNPVRAFKTNPLGQFASATQLLNGIYTISFEDTIGKHNFDTVEITANGQIIPPIEVVSHDQREDLRKALFGN